MTDADELKAEIAATRAELAETADALAGRVQRTARLGTRIAAAAAGAALAVVIVQRIRAHRSAG